jgi:hypothetical protein
MRRRRPRLVGPPELGPYAAGEIMEAISEQEKAGRPVAPLVYPVMPPDTPPDVIAAMRESGALPPLPAPEPPPG